MSLELSLVFPDPQHVIIQSQTGSSQPFIFKNPLTDAVLKDIRWYLEVYSTQYMTDIDDTRARSIEQLLPEWGIALFISTLGQLTDRLALYQFYEQKQGRLLRIRASHPNILSLPWELLHIPNGDFLFNITPQISIRRQLNVADNFNQTKYKPKKKIRILFIISRPSNAGFIDPRSDAQAVLDALQEEGKNRIEIEFLRPATIDALRHRISDQQLPEIDIIHFDGHGVYDADGRWFIEANPNVLFGLTESNSTTTTAGTGYLLFEDERGRRVLISAEKLSNILNKQKVGLIVLSACQSAMTVMSASSDIVRGANETRENNNPATDAIGSVAARLTHTGIPTVLAMAYSVLVSTTRELFGEFYRNLALGFSMGEALDNARRHLSQNPERGERSRGQAQVTLELQDWFLPTLYQAGADMPLLQAIPDDEMALVVDNNSFGNLPQFQESSFWGRSWELWQIERAFLQGTRLISVVGFTGQGKTFLVQEAGRWLCQTGLFAWTCFVDYANFQGIDAVDLAVNTLGMVLDQSLDDVTAASTALAQTSTLLILDNLEVLSERSLQDLLDTAYSWSQEGKTRVLLTSCQLDFNHPRYKLEEDREHFLLILQGLGSEQYPADALAYFESLWLLPPTPSQPMPSRATLINLFKLVDFHPLSIRILVSQLRERQIAELGQRLERLLAEKDEPTELYDCKGLLVSLQLSLERLGSEAQHLLSNLGVLQGGAFEDNLLVVVGLNPTEKLFQSQKMKKSAAENLQRDKTISPEEKGLSDEQGIWPMLRQELVASGILLSTRVPGVCIPYLKLHPTIGLVLWTRLTQEEQAMLMLRHRQRYLQFSTLLYSQDNQNPELVRTIARWELPNLMMAVKGALLESDDEEVSKFVSCFTRFLQIFGLNRDRQMLSDMLIKTGEGAESESWYFTRCNYGETLMSKGLHAEATKVFEEVLVTLGDTPNYNLCHTLDMVGRCLAAQGKMAQAAQYYQRGLALITQLEQGYSVKHLQCAMYINLANVLLAVNKNDDAKEVCKTAIEVAQSLKDSRLIAILNGQRANLALNKGDIQEAIKLREIALQNFQKLGEPLMEAYQSGQLGALYNQVLQWEEAERHYRKAAQIRDKQGDLAGAANMWCELARINKITGQVDVAVAYYEKALEHKELLPFRGALLLNNLADLLQNQQNASGQFPHLSAAQQHAEASLTIKKTLDPAATKIWTTYQILAEIAEKQSHTAEARDYRKQARQTKLAFGIEPQELRRWGPLIIDTVATATGDTTAQARLLPLLDRAAEGEYSKQIAAIRRIIAGDRDEEALVDHLDPEDSMVILTILNGLTNPSLLGQWLV